jgi:hypothetical protein
MTCIFLNLELFCVDLATQSPEGRSHAMNYDFLLNTILFLLVENLEESQSQV